ncbi:tetraspanin-3-like isoform X2 [Porites lutea]|uniref:tetraspanin-3-like isoform X2 n=1 Tax=Porites lutea TaxID=51062 RepID=UPI003CC5E501
MSCAKAFLFFFNFIYLGVSAAIIFVAAWVIKKYGDITKITTDTYTLVPCGILVGVGVLIFITALCGCCGTCRDNKCCLSTAKEFVNDGFIDAIKHYDYEDSSLDKAVDDLQSKLKCCGSHGPIDWIKYGQRHHPPHSCFSDHYSPYTEGCLDKITDDVKKNLSYVLGTAIGVAVLQLLGMIVACYLMCCSRESGYLRLEGGIRV